MRKVSLVCVLAVFFLSPAVFAQDEPVDLQVVQKIKMEGFQDSHVMETLSYLTEVYGPRLSGSPNLQKAMEWSRDKLTEWGLANARLEPWGTFGKGWSTEEYAIEMTEPVYMNVIAYPKAWTRSTDGIVEGTPVLINTENIKSADDLEQYKGKLGDGILMIRSPEMPEMSFEPLATRHSEEKLHDIAMAPSPSGNMSRAMRARYAQYRARRKLRNKINAFLKEEGAKVVLEPSGRSNSIVRVSSGGSRDMHAEAGIPQMVLAKEHYNRIARLIEMKIPVKLRIHIKNKFYTDDSLGYNVVAEIPGSDKKLAKELVMLGGHIDSWHAGTGATDNASGCAVMLEVVRILKAIGVKPRRTIRIALWSAEEQGLLGSRGYVSKVFGNPQEGTTTQAYKNFSAYYNLDNGSGKIRGVYLQGNDAVRPIFEAFLGPFHDLGAATLTIRNTGGTDHLSFDRIGLPGFQFIQDPLDYGTRTHHTDLDTYDHTQPDDLKQAAVIVASFVYHTAMRNEKLPRKPLPPAGTRGRRGRRTRTTP